MIKISVFYPSKPDGYFDFDYYLTKHIPWTLEVVGSAATFLGVEEGVSSSSSDSAAPFLAACHFTCTSPEALMSAMGLHREALLADIANYTNIRPIIQASKIRLGHY